MGANKFAGIIAGAGLLMTAGFAQAGSAVRIEPLDGTQSVTNSAGGPAIRSERGPLLSAESQSSALALHQSDPVSRTTPFGSPLPPSQLTPAPVLPFVPNRSLVPFPSAPVPYSGSGRFSR